MKTSKYGGYSELESSDDEVEEVTMADGGRVGIFGE